MPDRAGDIRIVWKSPMIPADPMVWRKDLPESVKAKIRTFMLSYGQSGANKEQELANLKVLTWSGWRASNNDQLLPIRQLELFKTRAKVEGDTTLADAERKAKLAEIDAKLADLQKVASGK